MQGSIGIMLMAAVVAILLAAGTSSLPWVGGVCVVAGVAVALDRRRTGTPRQSAT